MQNDNKRKDKEKKEIEVNIKNIMKAKVPFSVKIENLIAILIKNVVKGYRGYMKFILLFTILIYLINIILQNIIK